MTIQFSIIFIGFLVQDKIFTYFFHALISMFLSSAFAMWVLSNKSIRFSVYKKSFLGFHFFQAKTPIATMLMTLPLIESIFLSQFFYDPFIIVIFGFNIMGILSLIPIFCQVGRKVKMV